MELKIRFDRSAVINVLSAGKKIEIKITGELSDGTIFEGYDTIKVIGKVKHRGIK